MPVLKFLFSKDKQISDLHLNQKDVGEWFAGLYQSFIDWFSAIAKGDPYTALAYLSIGLVIVTLLKNAARFTAMNYMVLIRNKSVRQMRLDIYEKCLNLPIAYFNNERKGDLISKMSNDIKEIEFALMVSLEALYFQPLNIIIFMMALVVLSAKLTMYILLFLPITAAIIALIGRSLRKKSGKNQQLLGRVMSSFEETLGGIRVIKAFNASKFFYNRYSDQDLDYTKNNISVQRRYDLSSPVSETIGIAVSALLLWLGGKMVFSGELDPEFFLGYFTIFSQLIPPFKGFSNALYAAQKGMASLERIQDLVTAPVVVEDPQNPKNPKFESTLELANVGFSYVEGSEVLSNVSLKINKGETIAFVGPSGAGKTTITDLIARFYDVSSGAILLDGVDIREFNQEDLRQLVGIVNQESILFNDTIRNNVALGRPDLTMEQVQSAAKAAYAHDFIMDMEKGYESEIGERGGKLSGGQKQRLSIARALLKDPEILILDEATSALDSQSEKAVQMALEELMRNRTSLVVAHRLSTVMHADKIVVLEKGKIIEIGKHQELIAKGGLYSKLIQLQELG
ncbi:MAG: ABC transporter ATP-binding protein [Crocinitomicaceae bacterium]|nr:ABC transporter ATP-binding protein [Crocinitomicaceae bacterium]